MHLDFHRFFGIVAGWESLKICNFIVFWRGGGMGAPHHSHDLRKHKELHSLLGAGRDVRIGGEFNWEIVSFRSVVCACAHSGCVMKFEPENRDRPFLFAFYPAELSLSLVCHQRFFNFPLEELYL